MGVKVYGAGMSTCTSRVLAYLLKKEVDHELVPVNMMVGEHKQPPFLAKNPFGQIPVLEDEDLTIFESRAITAHISHKYKDQGADLLRHGTKSAAISDSSEHVKAECPYTICFKAGCAGVILKYTGFPDELTRRSGAPIHFLKCAVPSCQNIKLIRVGSPPWSLANDPDVVPCYWCGVVGNDCICRHCNDMGNQEMEDLEDICTCPYNPCQCYDSLDTC